jgi:heterodisulfide reductase subunit A
VAQASAAASKALELLSKPELLREPTTAVVNEALCMACLECVRICPYGAVAKHEIRNREGKLVRTVARVNPAMCEGCGLCVGGCRSSALDLQGYTDSQVYAQIEALMQAGASA